MSAITELQDAVATIAEGVGPSIVGIGRGTRGSGVVIGAGKVLTNAHNLRGDEVTVTFADGRSLIGTVAGWDGDGPTARVSLAVFVNPLVSWIWAGGVLLLLGTVVTMWPAPMPTRLRSSVAAGSRAVAASG